jgi:hypothetical protein
MSDIAIFSIIILFTLVVFFAMRSSHWKRRYNTLLNDAFERGCRAVVIKDDPTK